MVFLEYERRLFQQVKDRFVDYYKEALEGSSARFLEQAEISDIESPIHHRVSAEAMAYEIAKKARRIEAAQAHVDWQVTPRLLNKLIEETKDIINYAAFLSALCAMLKAEQEGRNEAGSYSSPNLAG